jgi:excisionase family DNA binding protein
MRDRSNLQSNSSPVQTLVPQYVPATQASGPTVLATRMTVDEIARRLDIGRLAVYAMLEQGIIPAVRLGRRWIVTRHAFENWERTCGIPTGIPTGLQPRTEQLMT